jgi:nicotinamidase-related amidase
MAGPAKNRDLHGNVPDRCPVALLLIDVINDLDFPDNAGLLKKIPRLTKKIVALKARCAEKRIPVIYVNDNQGRWRSDLAALLTKCLKPDAPGRSMVERLAPAATDYLVLKPKHSAFYATPLDTLLSYLDTKAVILAGLTTSSCILLTAGEMYVRDLRLFVPSDCVAALHARDHRNALYLMRSNFEANTDPSAKLNFAKLLRNRK